MNKRLWIVLSVLVIAAVGGLIWWKTSQPDEASYVDHLDPGQLITKQDIIDAKKKVDPNQEIDESTIIPDHFLGNKDSKVIVIEYEDFACSHCQAFHVYVTKIHEDYKDDVLFIHRNFSLGYPNSVASISAAEAAFLIGGEKAFWKMTDLLFQDTMWISEAVPSDQRKEVFSSHAEEIGLDVDKFNEALINTSKNGIQAKMSRDKALGVKAEVTGTPTWLVNGKKVDQIKDEDIRKAIDDAINENK